MGNLKDTGKEVTKDAVNWLLYIISWIVSIAVGAGIWYVLREVVSDYKKYGLIIGVVTVGSVFLCKYVIDTYRRVSAR